MRCWIFFHRDLTEDQPESWEILRFQESAARMGIALEVLRPRQFELVVDPDRGWSAVHAGQALDKPDFLISRIGSETSYFTLAVLRHFERQGVTMINGPAAIENVADKLHTLQILSAHGLPTPKTILCKFPVDVELIARELGFPVVVKTLMGTRGSGVLLCTNRDQFADLANLLADAQSGANFIFQQYIEASHGRDVRVLVVMGKAVAAMERRATDGGFKSNVSLGGMALPIALDPELKRLAENVARALDLDVAGVDILFDRDGYRICEANSAPGFRGLEQATGLDIPGIMFSAMRRGLPVAGSPLRRAAAYLRRMAPRSRAASVGS